MVKVYEELENSAFEGTIIDIETIGDFDQGLLDPEEINALKPSINNYSDLLVRLIQKVKETPT